jgi:hypothetical protein
LTTIADQCAVKRVLKHTNELIEEYEVEMRPEKITHVVNDIQILSAAKPLFTEDAWLAVEDVLSRVSGKDLLK